ncbi:hypothetical protein ACLI4U_12760 [Natrialbaceae archaeon A-CW2]
MSKQDSITTATDIKKGEFIDIPLRVDEIRNASNSKIHAQLECSDVKDQHVRFTIWAQNEEWVTFPFEEGKWYEFKGFLGKPWENGVNVDARKHSTVEKIDPPEVAIGAKLEEEEPQVTTEQLSSRGAFDIEVLTTVPEAELDLDNSDHVEILCVGLGHQPQRGVPCQSEFILREERTPESELACIEEAVVWLEEHDFSSILTYNGEFDFKHLRGRAKRAADDSGERTRGENLAKRIDDLEAIHIDLMPLSKLIGRGSKLEDVTKAVGEPVQETHWDIYNHGLHPGEDWRKEQWDAMGWQPADDPSDCRVFAADIPHFGRAYLEHQQGNGRSSNSRALRELLRHYTLGDISPLFAIAEDDRVNGEFKTK